MRLRLLSLPFFLLSLCASVFLPLNALATERIVTIGGDVTEIAYALGAGSEIVARDSTSQHPQAALMLPDVGYMRMLNAEGILAMKPTMLLVSELAQPSLVLKQVADSGVSVVTVPGQTTPESVSAKISAVAMALHQPEQGQKLIKDYQQRLAAVSNTPLPVKVLFVMSHGGLTPMAAGQNTAADAMIRAAGGSNAMQGFSRYRPLSQEGVIASSPDLLLITRDGVKALGGSNGIWKLPGVAMTPAGKHQRLLVVDDMALLGFGLKTPQVLALLRESMEQAQ
ncbi:heme/hemin ABC transporter substrate-binding protein [Yersinia aldovae]|uniref:Hemin-binding periplasmic protein n=1 Tax=Yersinia aldovae TaxID=29483 RepID=A0A0T9UQ09_YERAL|nr:hemin ABC transporter substrate-binding protein [Yersinia aldovae]AJJ61302.1 hemin-binding periplasmic protein hmuT [Yersinia aldovae 670-83]CNK02909.1 hemin-binding periplasmic protein [Yersinia aldovae]CNL60320.1 hemin-binding periplasmic protein [Yersinia aldovae]